MQLLQNEPLSGHTTFRIGGPAEYYAIPKNTDEIKESIAFAKEKNLPFYMIGKGSNMLFADEGFHGVIIEIGKGMEQIEFLDNNRVKAQAGVGLSTLCSAIAAKSLAGLEFASGIPGTLGGAVTMNAGAYGGEIKDCIECATLLDPEGNIISLDKEELELGYRSSIVQKKDLIVVDATFCLESGNQDEIRAHMKELNARRRDKQPLEYPSAGSTFKRPEGYFAGKLIQDAGLRGYRVGDAQVSEKHCGFVVNLGNATANDVKQLIEDVQNKVYETFGVKLEPEVRIVK